MIIKQVSIFIENKAGRLSEVSRILGDAGVNIRTLSLADSSDYGVLRLIVDDPQKAVDVLNARGITSSMTDMIALEVMDQPGGLADILDRIASLGLNVAYMYAFVEKVDGKAVVVFRFEDMEKASQKISQDSKLTFLIGEKIQIP